ncbi:F-box only protein 13-like isoform X1 [Zingiber officinale]|uniref:F-box domain-containing protein n=2 Tax=Zingiber officinale TaxID=94328 RepID=A0A8J5GS37_ZINOF|nr:F-box only protein 13-like isoform X1 [Zingiber officinale]KAG6508935.1 hypothetical protein ZIOFF_034317 [Zingiber officinale]
MIHLAAGKSRKRKEIERAFSFNDLNQDLLERVLSWLPASSFMRLRTVCKRWNSIAKSRTFQAACAHIPSRSPWFLMVDQELDQSIVYDAAEGDWKALNPPIQFLDRRKGKPIPVAASGATVCYQTVDGDLEVCNPVTGSCRKLPHLRQSTKACSVRAIAMHSTPSSSSSYKVVVVSGEFTSLAFRVFDSMRGLWDNEVKLVHETKNSAMSCTVGGEVFYFLSKAGDVVATGMQRSLSKQYSSVLTIENGEEIVYFISPSATVAACNLAQKAFYEYPRLLPIYSEYSIDVVECNGEMLVVLLSEFLDTASLRVWRFSKEDVSWRQVATMPPAMAHEFYGKKLDINCCGHGSMILMCFHSDGFSRCVMFRMEANEWVELPECFVYDCAKEFMSAFSFEPRMEVVV